MRSVAAEANRIAPAFGDGELLVTAAVLHDIGYAPDLVMTEFHPLDGARFLQTQDAPARLCALVARHSCAIKEAELRGCHADVAEFPDEETPLRDALWYCDMVTGPDGQRLTVDDRLAEIRNRYGSESLVGQFLDIARPELIAAVDRTIERYTAAGIPQPKYG
ncbi:HD domain-containing protein [Pseudonocardia broussonetiae]|uniref:HD domain-containing protein n=1 Tax=Pseudonocardia broussonetiae TaxID=2736640 RepID=UPI001F0402DF|nr:HD domain-containing protein [Pseudonocardia broussonetiae]